MIPNAINKEEAKGNKPAIFIDDITKNNRVGIIRRQYESHGRSDIDKLIYKTWDSNTNKPKDIVGWSSIKTWISDDAKIYLIPNYDYSKKRLVVAGNKENKDLISLKNSLYYQLLENLKKRQNLLDFALNKYRNRIKKEINDNLSTLNTDILIQEFDSKSSDLLSSVSPLEYFNRIAKLKKPLKYLIPLERGEWTYDWLILNFLLDPILINLCYPKNSNMHQLSYNPLYKEKEGDYRTEDKMIELLGTVGGLNLDKVSTMLINYYRTGKLSEIEHLNKSDEYGLF